MMPLWSYFIWLFAASSLAASCRGSPSNVQCSPIAFTPAPRGPHTVLPACDDCISSAQRLPFDFPFFGSTYSDVWVGSDGFLSLSGSGFAAIEVFGCDLNPTLGGNMSIIASSTRWTASWSNVAYSGRSGSVTFHCSLFPDGRIEFHFETCPSKGITHVIKIIDPLTGTSLVWDESANALSHTAVAFVTSPAHSSVVPRAPPRRVRPRRALVIGTPTATLTPSNTPQPSNWTFSGGNSTNSTNSTNMTATPVTETLFFSNARCVRFQSGLFQFNLTCLANCSTNDTAFLSTGSCWNVTATDYDVVNITQLDAEETNTSFSIMLDTDSMYPVQYRLCWQRTGEPSMDSGLTIDVIDFTSLYPQVLGHNQDQFLAMECTGSACSSDDAQVYLTTLSCIGGNRTALPSEKNSPPGLLVDGYFDVDASGLEPTTGALLPFKVCYRCGTSIGSGVWIDTGLEIPVEATSISVMSPDSLPKGSSQVVNITCGYGCNTSNADAIYLSKLDDGTTAAPCQEGIEGPQGVSSTQSAPALLEGSAPHFQVTTLDTSGLDSGVYHVCVRVNHYWRDSAFEIEVTDTELTGISFGSILGSGTSQPLSFACPAGCSGNVLLVPITMSCSDAVSSGTTTATAVAVSGGTANVDTSTLSAGEYRVCYSSASEVSQYRDSGLTTTVRGTAVMDAAPQAIVSASGQRLNLTCTAGGCQANDGIFLAAVSCSVTPQATLMSTAKALLDGQLRGTLDASMLAANQYYKLCFLPQNGQAADTGITILVRPTIVTFVSPTSFVIGLSSRLALTVNCSSACQGMSVYLSTECSQAPAVNGSSTTATAAVVIGARNIATVNTSRLVAATYRVCLANASRDTGLTVQAFATSVTGVDKSFIFSSPGQLLTFSCIAGCGNGDFVYISRVPCQPDLDTTSNGVTSPKAVLSGLKALLDASGLPAQPGYRICYRAGDAPYVDVGLTIDVRAGPVGAISPTVFSQIAAAQVVNVACFGCSDNSKFYFTKGGCVSDHGASPTSGSGSTGILFLKGNKLSLNALQLETGTYKLCYWTPSAWVDTQLTMNIIPTTLSAVHPQAISAAAAQAVDFDCTAPCPNRDAALFLSTNCSTTAVSGTTSPTTALRDTTALFDASGLEPQAYHVCYQPAGTWMDTQLTLNVMPTEVTAVSPAALVRSASAQLLNLRCASKCANGDQLYLTSGACSSSTGGAPAASNSNSGGASLNALTASISTSSLDAGVYRVCYQPAGGNWADTRLTIVITETKLLSASPSTIGTSSGERVTFSCVSGACAVSDMAYLTSTGICSGTSTGPQAASKSSSQAFNVLSGVSVIDTSSLDSGSYIVCFQSVGSVFQNSRVTLQVVDTRVVSSSSPSPSPSGGGCDGGLNPGSTCTSDSEINDALSDPSTVTNNTILESSSGTLAVIVVNAPFTFVTSGAIMTIVNSGAHRTTVESLVTMPFDATSCGAHPRRRSAGRPFRVTRRNRDNTLLSVPSLLSVTMTMSGLSIGVNEQLVFYKWTDCGNLVVLSASVQIVASSFIVSFSTLTTSTFLPAIVNATDTATSSSSSSLSGGAVAGIVVGSVVGGLLLIGIVAGIVYSTSSRRSSTSKAVLTKSVGDVVYDYTASGFTNDIYPSTPQATPTVPTN